MNNDEIATCPLTGWDIKTVDQLETVIFQPHYITAPTNNPDADSVKDLSLIMTLQQTKELRDVLDRAVERLEMNARPKPKHEVN